MIVNNYLMKGYRVGFRTLKEVFKSLFMIHNETMNVWTHLLGAFFFIFVAVNSLIYLRGFADNAFDYHTNFMSNFQ